MAVLIQAVWLTASTGSSGGGGQRVFLNVWETFLNFISWGEYSVIKGIGDAGLTTSMLNWTLNIEMWFDEIGLNFDNLELLIATFALALLTLKFVKKIADVYALQVDGDPNGDIAVLITNYCKAIVITICFSMIWAWLVEILQDFARQMIHAVGAADLDMVAELEDLANNGAADTSSWFWRLVYFLMGGILMLSLLGNSLEFWLVRLGVPFAACGLLDSDGGVWKQYMRIFLKDILTILIKILMWQVSSAIMVLGSGAPFKQLIIAILAMVVAFKTPKLLSELLIQQGAGGGGKLMNYVYLGSMVMRSVV